MRLSLPLLLLLTAMGVAQEPSVAEDEAFLRRNQVGVDAAGLVRFFKERTLSKEQIAQLQAKVEMLGSPKFADRKQASIELIRAGHNARPLLLKVVNDPDAELEMRRRAELCLRDIVAGTDAEQSQAAARLLLVRKVPETCNVLLDFQPFATEPALLETMQTVLNKSAVRDGVAEVCVVEALTDRSPGKRGMAAEALIRAGGLKQKEHVEKLLKDPRPEVRLQVTTALVENRDKDAVAALIDLMTDVSKDDLWKVDDLLGRVAGEPRPPIWIDSQTPVKKAKSAWQDWWKANEGKIDLAKMSDAPASLGLTLVTYMTQKTTNGTLVEIGLDRKPKWKIDNLRYPVDAQIIGPDRILLTEYLPGQITERDFKGKVLKTTTMQNAVGAQRFPDGSTFMVSRRMVQYVDRNGKDLFTRNLQTFTITAGGRSRDGYIAYINLQGQLTMFDPKGQEVKSFQAGRVNTMSGVLDIAPGGRVLVARYSDNQVTEYDRDGKSVWSVNVPNPASASRLPNGNILVVSGVGANRVVEYTKDGREVWSHQTEGRIWRARRR